MDNVEQTQTGPRPWPSYRSHKVVQAAQIRNVTAQDSGHYLVALDDFPHVQVEAKFFARGVATRGDYLVRYEDGFMSWSPRVPFEAGYAEAGPDGTAGVREAAPTIPTQQQMNQAFYVDVCRAEDRLKELCSASQTLLDSLPPHWHDGATVDLQDLVNETDALLNPHQHDDRAVAEARKHYRAASVVPRSPPDQTAATLRDAVDQLREVGQVSFGSFREAADMLDAMVSPDQTAEATARPEPVAPAA